MERLQLVRAEGSLALFRWAGDAQQSSFVGLLIDEASAQRSKPALQAFWEGDTACAIVIAPSEPRGDLEVWATYLDYSPQSEDNLVTWLEASLGAAPDASFSSLLFTGSLRVNRKTGRLNAKSSFNLGALQVIVKSGAGGSPALASWDYDSATLRLSDTSFYAVRLDDEPREIAISPPAPVTMGLGGDEAGGLIFQIQDQDAYLLFGLLDDPPPRDHPPTMRPLPEIRYFHPGGKLSFPMAAPIGKGKLLTADVHLNPSQPFSALHTFFTPDLLQPALVDLFTCHSIRQTNGHVVTLVPADGFGFHLAATPNYCNNRWRCFYPAPFGPMTIVTDDVQHAQNEPVKLMCGLSGLEYLQIKEGGTVTLVPGQNAYAPHFIPPSLFSVTPENMEESPDGRAPVAHGLLSDRGQTSWFSVQGQSGYYSQSYVEPFFATRVMQNQGAEAFPSAVSSYLSDPNLPRGVARAAGPAFPFAPCSAVYDESGANPNVAPDVFAAYEAQVLVQHRYAVLVPDHAVPVFEDHTGRRLSGAAVTPTGFIARFAPGPEKAVSRQKEAGLEAEPAAPALRGWSSLTLARHTENSGAPRELRYSAASLPSEGSGAVNPRLSQALLQPSVFLVADNWDVLGDITPELVVDGLAFHLRPRPTTDADKPIVIFKFQTSASLEDLIGRPDLWCDRDYWVSGDLKGSERVREAIEGAITEADRAKGTPTDRYEYFRDTIARDAKWTGVVFFHVPIDAGGMPPDRQMLFAGIDGQLYAHHFGVHQNRLTINSDGTPELEQSSFFGVIHYPPASRPPARPAPLTLGEGKLAFNVLDLTVEIENSVVTHFDALAAMTIPELFDRQVAFRDQDLEELMKDFPQLPPGFQKLANTLVIRGVYQRQGQGQDGSVGTVRFQRKDPLTIPIFKQGKLRRVIDHFQVTAAVLAPVTGTSDGPTPDASRPAQSQEVKARFSLGGQLCFSRDPFGVANPADLFSFGKPDASGRVVGLGLDGLGFKLSFSLDRDGKRKGETTIEADYSQVRVSESPEGIRDNSLLAGFPMRVTGFIHADTEEKFTPSGLAASPMHVVNIKGHDTVRPVAAIAASRGIAAYALECDLPLGSLGALAGPHAEISAKMLLGWGPDSATPDNDAAQVMVRLPNLSAGAAGFNLEGLIQVGFKDANLGYLPKTKGGQDYVYVALFNNVNVQLFGMTFPPNVLANFLLMSGPEDPAHQNVAWYLSAAQKCDD